LGDEIAQNTKMTIDKKEPDMLIRIRPVQDGWEVLTRLTPRPLSARHWRVANMQGALNANVAAAMVDLTYPQPDDRYLNLMCGSGTLLVERGMVGLAEIMVGTELETDNLAMTKTHLQESEVTAFLVNDNDKQLPFPDKSFNKIVADFPWGQFVQAEAGIYALYADTFKEVERVATDGATFVLITHNDNSFRHVLAQYENWYITQKITLNRGKINPDIYVLQRN
jgi:23S rRNA G2445 N2-methylase RlmL